VKPSQGVILQTISILVRNPIFHSETQRFKLTLVGFARIGLGICYDIRFPELAMISARQGKSSILNSWSYCLDGLHDTKPGCQMIIYPGAFNLTTGSLHWELLQRSRSVRVMNACLIWDFLPRAVDNQIFVGMCSPARDMTAAYHAVRPGYLRNDVSWLLSS